MAETAIAPPPRRTRLPVNSPNYKFDENFFEDLDESDDAVDEDEDDGVTRCVCGQTESFGTMIQCDTCSVWQHCDCVGLSGRKNPKNYYCELCQPEGHPYFKKKAKDALKSQDNSINGKSNTPKKRNTMNSRDAELSYTEIIKPHLTRRSSADASTAEDAEGEEEFHEKTDEEAEPEKQMDTTEACDSEITQSLATSRISRKKREHSDPTFADETPPPTKRAYNRKPPQLVAENDEPTDVSNSPSNARSKSKASDTKRTGNRTPKKDARRNKDASVITQSNSTPPTPTRKKRNTLADDDDTMSENRENADRSESPTNHNQSSSQEQADTPHIRPRPLNPKLSIQELNKRARQMSEYINKLDVWDKETSIEESEFNKEKSDRAAEEDESDFMQVDVKLENGSVIPSPLHDNESSIEILKRLRVALRRFEERFERFGVRK